MSTQFLLSEPALSHRRGRDGVGQVGERGVDAVTGPFEHPPSVGLDGVVDDSVPAIVRLSSGLGADLPEEGRLLDVGEKKWVWLR